MKFYIAILFLYGLSLNAEMNLGEQAYVDSLTPANEDIDLDLESADSTPLNSFNKESELAIQNNQHKLSSDHKLDDAEELLKLPEVPREKPEVVEKRLDEAKRKKALKDYMVTNDIDK